MKKIRPYHVFCHLGFILGIIFHVRALGAPVTIRNLSSRDTIVSLLKLDKNDQKAHLLLKDDGQLGLNYFPDLKDLFLKKNEFILLDFPSYTALILSISHDKNLEHSYFCPVIVFEHGYLYINIGDFRKERTDGQNQQGLELTMVDPTTNYFETFPLAQETHRGFINFTKNWLHTLTKIVGIVMPDFEDEVEFGSASESDESEPSDSEE